MTTFWISLNVALNSMKDCLALIAVLFVGRYFYRLTTNIKLEEQIVTGNTAMGVTKAGYMAGLAIAATGGIWTVPDVQHKALMIGIIGLISMVLLRLSLIVNDKLILNKFNNLKEIVENQNLGIAFVEAGGTVATGFMIAGAMSGKADSLLEKLEYGTFYWVVGQIVLVLSCHIYHAICGFDVDDELLKKNFAPGISFGGFLVAVGIITDAAMYGVSTDLSSELITTGVFIGIGLVLLVLGKLALAKIMMPKANISNEISRDKNSGAAALSAIGYIALAIIFSASIAPATTSAAFGGSEPPPEVAADDSAAVQEAIDKTEKDIDAAVAPKADAKSATIPEPETGGKK